jgi:hypothetical protein
MSLRRNGLFVVPVMLGCWTLKPADEVPDGGADVARSDVGADVASRDDVSDASQQDLASMDAVRFDGGMDAGPSDVPMDAVRLDVRMDVLPIDVPMDAARFDVRMDVAPVDAPDVIVPVDVPVTIPTGLRLIGPPVLSTVADRQPRLSWSGNVSGLTLAVCRDRDCSAPVYTALVNGTEHLLTAALVPGVYFWNLRRPGSGQVISATWQFRVPNVSNRRPGVPTGVSHRDMDNDGFADIALGAPGPSGGTAGGSVQVHFGAESPSMAPGLTRAGPLGTSGLGYGWSLAWGDFNGDNLADLAVGSFDPMRNPQGSIDALYAGAGRTFSTASQVLAVGAVAPYFFPSSMATGDLNGDGRDDLAVAAAGGIGQVQIHLGGSLGLSASPSLVIPGPQGRPVAFGAATAVLGDVDGDGYGDLLVSDGCDASTNDGDPPVCLPTAQGRMHIFFGRANWTTVDSVRVTIEGDPSGRLGRSVAPAGDVNRDGYADFIASGTTGNDKALSGIVHLYLGRSRALWSPSVRPAASLRGTLGSQLLGVSVAAADVNRDGFTDILAGAPGREGTVGSYQGRVMVWLANGTVGYNAAVERSPDGTLGGLYGQVVAAPGDVNGDGHADVLVTAPMAPDRTVSQGQAFLWASPTARFPGTDPSLVILGGPAGGWLGRAATR